MSIRELQAMQERFSKGATVYVQRRPYAGKQTVHEGVVIDRQKSFALIEFTTAQGYKKQELIALGRLLDAPPVSELPPPPPAATESAYGALRAVPAAFANGALGAGPRPRMKQRPAKVEPLVEIELSTEQPPHGPCGMCEACQSGSSFDVGCANGWNAKPAHALAVVTQPIPDSQVVEQDPTLDPEISAYLEMGSGLLQSMRDKAKRLRAESVQCAAEAEALADASDRKLELAAQLDKQIEGLEALNKHAQRVAM
jgi:hypothetical protein